MSPWMRRITRQMQTGKPVLYFEDGRWRSTWGAVDAVTYSDDEREVMMEPWHAAQRWIHWANEQDFAKGLAYDYRCRHHQAVRALRLVSG